MCFMWRVSCDFTVVYGSVGALCCSFIIYSCSRVPSMWGFPSIFYTCVVLATAGDIQTSTFGRFYWFIVGKSKELYCNGCTWYQTLTWVSLPWYQSPSGDIRSQQPHVIGNCKQVYRFFLQMSGNFQYCILYFCNNYNGFLQKNNEHLICLLNCVLCYMLMRPPLTVCFL